MLRADKELLIFELDQRYKDGHFLTNEDIDYLIKLIENDLNG